MQEAASAPGGSISFERLAKVYDATRGGMERGHLLADDIFDWVDNEPIIELGVGTGAVALPIHRGLGRTVLGLDISPTMATQARDRLGEGTVMVGDVCTLPVRTGRVGTIICVWVLHLVEDLQRVLDECARVLRPHDGVMAVVVAGGRFRQDDIDDIVRPTLDRFTRRGAFKDAVVEAAAFAGLEVDAEGLTAELEWEQSPEGEAQRMEARNYGSLLDLDDASFQQYVQPAVDALRALPEPERARRRAVRYDYVILQKPWV